MKTTWTQNGRKHTARSGRIIIGRVTEMQCKTDEPFLGVVENGLVKQFLILQHAKNWIEDLYVGIDETDAM